MRHNAIVSLDTGEMFAVVHAESYVQTMGEIHEIIALNYPGAHVTGIDLMEAVPSE